MPAWAAEWAPPAELALGAIAEADFDLAMRVSADVRRFVQSFEGDLVRVRDGHGVRLTVKNVVVILRLESKSKTVRVMAIVPRRKAT
jgi:hypothetical protein